MKAIGAYFLLLNKKLTSSIHEATIDWTNRINNNVKVDCTTLIYQESLIADESYSKHPKTKTYKNGLRIVLDARIDNKNELLAHTALDKFASDEELVLRLYEKHGTDCSKQLVGAWSFIIWDQEKQRLFCARDQMGIKPIVYYFKNGQIIISTRRKEILSIHSVDRAANWTYILHSMSSMGYRPEWTAFKYINYLLPGHQMIVTPDGIKTEKYWELDTHLQAPSASEEEYIEEFRRLLKKSIECRMVGSTTVGTHLSGGLDSSGITAVAELISREKNITTKVLSYNVPRDTTDNKKMLVENMLAFDIIDQYNLHDKFINVHEPLPRKFRDLVADEADACDSLSQSNNVNTEYEIQAAAQKAGVQTVLSGFPGDELVTSFARTYFYEYLERGEYLNFLFKQKDSSLKNKHKVKTIGYLISNSISPKLTKSILSKINQRKLKSQKYHGRNIFLNRDVLKSSIGPNFMNPDFELLDDLIDIEPLSLRNSQRNHVCRTHTSRRVESEQLSGLKWGVNYRYPLADIRLLQFVLSLPMEMKISKNMTRKIFRLGMDGIIPDSIRLRDYKYAGSLKPLMRKVKRSQDGTGKELWTQFKTANCVDFLNINMIDKWFEANKSPFALINWLIYGQLAFDGKIEF